MTSFSFCFLFKSVVNCPQPSNGSNDNDYDGSNNNDNDGGGSICLPASISMPRLVLGVHGTPYSPSILMNSSTPAVNDNDDDDDEAEKDGGT